MCENRIRKNVCSKIIVHGGERSQILNYRITKDKFIEYSNVAKLFNMTKVGYLATLFLFSPHDKKAVPLQQNLK